MHGYFPAPLAELLEFDFTFHLFLILSGIVIAPLTYGTAKGYQIVRIFDLCHIEP